MFHYLFAKNFIFEFNISLFLSFADSETISMLPIVEEREFWGLITCELRFPELRREIACAGARASSSFRFFIFFVGWRSGTVTATESISSKTTPPIFQKYFRQIRESGISPPIFHFTSGVCRTPHDRHKLWKSFSDRAHSSPFDYQRIVQFDCRHSHLIITSKTCALSYIFAFRRIRRTFSLYFQNLRSLSGRDTLFNPDFRCSNV